MQSTQSSSVWFKTLDKMFWNNIQHQATKTLLHRRTTSSRESAACETVSEGWLDTQTPSCGAKDAGTPQEAPVNHQTAGTGNRWTDRHKHDLWPPNEHHDPLGILCNFTGIQKKDEDSKNTPSLTAKLFKAENKHGMFPKHSRNAPKQTWISDGSSLQMCLEKATLIKILQQLRNSMEKHLH